MKYPATTDPKFLSILESWFHSRPEIVVLVRYPYAAGAISFEFFSSLQNFCAGISQLPNRAWVIAFKQPQLQIRGVVDTAFIERCLKEIPDGQEYMVVETVHRMAGKHSWQHNNSGTSHAELREELEDCLGAAVAVGLYPSWLTDTDNVISAMVPDKDGIVRPAPH